MTEAIVLPTQRGIYYGGAWHQAAKGAETDVLSPATGEKLCAIAAPDLSDVDAAVAAARKGFEVWRDVPPLDRARRLKEVAQRVRKHGRELALLDAIDGGNPISELMRDINNAANQLEFFAGLVTEMKGSSVPAGPNVLNFSVKEPLGVVVRIIPFNHPFMFCAAKSAAPLAAGNSVIIKPPEQAPLSSLRFAELIGDLLPPGVFNVIPGGREVGAALASHPTVAMVALIGSVPTGRAVLKSAADTIKPVLLELGGKNAMIAFPDSEPAEAARAAIAGMNFTWCGQSCGSTSRAFIHESIYERVIARMVDECTKFKPGIPTLPETTMGSLASKAQYEKTLHYIQSAHDEGARLVYGGKVPTDPQLSEGYYIEPTVFADVTQNMRIASEEIFGPVLAVLPWSSEEQMLRDVNSVPYGLTCSIWTRDIGKAHRTAARVEAGFIWINETSKHFLGIPFGGYKQSGLGREECIAELISFTQEKHVHLNLGGAVSGH
jgi:betaine-aldehyde dehydrogenase